MPDHGNRRTPGLVARAVDVHRSFGDTVALDGVSLDVAPGEAVGLLGPNGAGKTTLISLLTGLRRPDRGAVELFGHPPSDPRARLRLGVTPQLTGVPHNLRVREIVELVAAHYPDPLDLDELLASVGLDGAARSQAGGLSGGTQRRLLVALALVGRPDLVVLDEPTTGLDVAARDALWDALRRYRADGGALLITSHYLAEVEALADRVVVVDHGRVIKDGTVEEITGAVTLQYVSFGGDLPGTPAALAALPAVVSMRRVDGLVTLATRDADATVRALVHADVPFSGLTVRRAGLEEAFLAMTGHGGKAGQDGGSGDAGDAAGQDAVTDFTAA